MNSISNSNDVFKYRIQLINESTGITTSYDIKRENEELYTQLSEKKYIEHLESRLKNTVEMVTKGGLFAKKHTENYIEIGSLKLNTIIKKQDNSIIFDEREFLNVIEVLCKLQLEIIFDKTKG